MRIAVMECEMPCMDFARYLLGKMLVRKLPNGALLKGMIVETEAYMGNMDSGSPSFGAVVSSRNAGFFSELGTTCVPLSNGHNYHSFYISSQEYGGGLLIRAVEPLEGLNYMQLFRRRNSNQPHNFRRILLCNGPHRLCMSFDITEETCNMINIFTSDFLWIEHSPLTEEDLNIVQCNRIGTTYKGAWSKLQLRFYIRGSPYVSRRDFAAENENM